MINSVQRRHVFCCGSLQHLQGRGWGAGDGARRGRRPRRTRRKLRCVGHAIWRPAGPCPGPARTANQADECQRRFKGLVARASGCAPTPPNAERVRTQNGRRKCAAPPARAACTLLTHARKCACKAGLGARQRNFLPHTLVLVFVVFP